MNTPTPAPQAQRIPPITAFILVTGLSLGITWVFYSFNEHKGETYGTITGAVMDARYDVHSILLVDDPKTLPLLGKAQGRLAVAATMLVTEEHNPTIHSSLVRAYQGTIEDTILMFQDSTIDQATFSNRFDQLRQDMSLIEDLFTRSDFLELPSTQAMRDLCQSLNINETRQYFLDSLQFVDGYTSAPKTCEEIK